MKQVAGQVGVNRPADSINSRHAQRFPEPLSAGAHWFRVRRGWHPSDSMWRLSPAFRDGALFVTGHARSDLSSGAVLASPLEQLAGLGLQGFGLLTVALLLCPTGLLKAPRSLGRTWRPWAWCRT